MLESSLRWYGGRAFHPLLSPSLSPRAAAPKVWVGGEWWESIAPPTAQPREALPHPLVLGVRSYAGGSARQARTQHGSSCDRASIPPRIFSSGASRGSSACPMAATTIPTLAAVHSGAPLSPRAKHLLVVAVLVSQASADDAPPLDTLLHRLARAIHRGSRTTALLVAHVKALLGVSPSGAPPPDATLAQVPTWVTQDEEWWQQVRAIDHAEEALLDRVLDVLGHAPLKVSLIGFVSLLLVGAESTDVPPKAVLPDVALRELPREASVRWQPYRLAE